MAYMVSIKSKRNHIVPTPNAMFCLYMLSNTSYPSRPVYSLITMWFRYRELKQEKRNLLQASLKNVTLHWLPRALLQVKKNLPLLGPSFLTQTFLDGCLCWHDGFCVSIPFVTLLVDEYVEMSTFDRAVKKLYATWNKMMFKCSVVKTKKISRNKPHTLNQG